jgi:aspartyl-tRNA(Asn)/glutamyl-tRNA(Gln) amidotransferase subunit C
VRFITIYREKITIDAEFDIINQMANLTHDDVLKLASLAKLQIEDSEIEQYTKELDEILVYVEQLSSIDVSGLEPTLQVNNLHNVMREDTVIDYGISQELLLQNLPQREGNLIKVARVL